MTAWAAGKFSGDAVASFVKKSGIADKVAHKKLIIPGYAASISGDMEEELPGWEVIIGPRDASLIPKFLKERVEVKGERLMLLIGENLNVINRVIGKAFKEKDPGPIAEEAKRQKEKGVDWIDINLGPARKGGPELMEFVVKTVQEAIGDTPPLCLDTSNIEAMEAGLSVHKGKAIINSIMCRPERYEKMIPLAVKYKANMIALMWGPEGLAEG